MKVALNRLIPSNYAFFDPVSRLHLTLSDPVAVIDEVTKPIEVALRTKTLIQLDGGEQVTNKKAKEETPSEPKETPSAEPETSKDEPQEKEVKKEESEVKVEAAPKKRGRSSKKAAE